VDKLRKDDSLRKKTKGTYIIDKETFDQYHGLMVRGRIVWTYERNRKK
jgi:hypothetical protein